ncbi:MAG: hypothetical protein QXG12_06140 [Thermoproteota archaeon]
MSLFCCNMMELPKVFKPDRAKFFLGFLRSEESCNPGVAGAFGRRGWRMLMVFLVEVG